MSQSQRWMDTHALGPKIVAESQSHGSGPKARRSSWVGGWSQAWQEEAVRVHRRLVPCGQEQQWTQAEEGTQAEVGWGCSYRWGGIWNSRKGLG